MTIAIGVPRLTFSMRPNQNIWIWGGFMQATSALGIGKRKGCLIGGPVIQIESKPGVWEDLLGMVDSAQIFGSQHMSIVPQALPDVVGCQCASDDYLANMWASDSRDCVLLSLRKDDTDYEVQKDHQELGVPSSVSRFPRHPCKTCLITDSLSSIQAAMKSSLFALTLAGLSSASPVSHIEERQNGGVGNGPYAPAVCPCHKPLTSRQPLFSSFFLFSLFPVFQPV
jgi:hypothetical protein